jgi:hypothetical protein
MKFKLLEAELKGSFASEDDFWATLKKGFEVEKEHADSVGNCPIIVTKIALDHLAEDIEYYAKLKKMEAGDKPKADREDEEPESEKDEDAEGGDAEGEKDDEDDDGEDTEDTEGEDDEGEEKESLKTA